MLVFILPVFITDFIEQTIILPWMLWSNSHNWPDWIVDVALESFMWLCLLSVLQAVTSEKTQLQIFNRKHLYKKYMSSQWCSTRSEMWRYFKLDWITNSRLKKLARIPFLPRTFISKEQYHKASPILSHDIHHTMSLDCELQFHCDTRLEASLGTSKATQHISPFNILKTIFLLWGPSIQLSISYSALTLVFGGGRWIDWGLGVREFELQRRVIVTPSLSSGNLTTTTGQSQWWTQ